MSEENVQDSVQENLSLGEENKPETPAKDGLLQEVMAKKAKLKEYETKISELESANEKRRQKQLSEDGKKDELISELNSKVEKLEGEYTRLSKYEDDEKSSLIASIASGDEEAGELSKESLSTLRLLKNKIATKTPETPTARGSVGNQLPTDITRLSEDGKKDELIAELNAKNEKLEGEYNRLSKYEDDEKTSLIASIASDDKEAEELSRESLSTLRLLKNKIAAKSPEPPTARGSIGYQKPLDINKMSSEERKENWGDIIKQYTKN